MVSKDVSTVQALLNHMQFMYDIVDSDNLVISVFFYCKEVFDKVDRKNVIVKI